MEMSTIVSENRITAALTHDVPSSVYRTYEVGEEGLVFREKEKNWTGPMVVVLVENKIITVKDLKSEPVLRFSTQQIKPFLRDSPSTGVDEDAIEISQAMLSRFMSTDPRKSRHHFKCTCSR
jgi:hypothetical protein